MMVTIIIAVYKLRYPWTVLNISWIEYNSESEIYVIYHPNLQYLRCKQYVNKDDNALSSLSEIISVVIMVDLSDMDTFSTLVIEVCHVILLIRWCSIFPTLW